jgi:hypothetical protein
MVVDDHAGDAGFGEGVEAFGEAGEGGFRGDDDDALDLVAEEEIELAGLEVGVVAGVGEEDAVVAVAGLGLDALGDAGDEAGSEGGEDEADGAGASADEAAGEEARAVAEAFGGGADAGAGGIGEGDVGATVEDEGDGGGGDAGGAGDFLDAGGTGHGSGRRYRRLD